MANAASKPCRWYVKASEKSEATRILLPSSPDTREIAKLSPEDILAARSDSSESTDKFPSRISRSQRCLSALNDWLLFSSELHEKSSNDNNRIRPALEKNAGIPPKETFERPDSIIF